MAKGGSLNVNPEEMIQYAKELKNCGEEYSSVLDHMTKQVNRICSNWTGSTSDAFDEQYNSLLPDLKKVKEVIESIADEVTSISKAYADMEESLSSQVRANA